MENEIVKWMQAWILFLAFGGDNLNYLTSDVGQSYSVHTHSLYFPLFGDIGTVERNIATKSATLDSGSRNIHLVAIANLSAYALYKPNSSFAVKWKNALGSYIHETVTEFRLDSKADLQRVENPRIQTHQIYFNVIKQQFTLLYLTIDLPITLECVGTHSFELLDWVNNTIAKSMEIHVKLKNAQVRLPQIEWVCNSKSDYCMVLRLQGGHIICQREEIDTESPARTEQSKVFYQFPAWIVYSLFALALLSIVVLIALVVSSLKARMMRKARTRQFVFNET